MPSRQSRPAKARKTTAKPAVQVASASAFNPGEQQVAPTLEGIRRDHVARYELAARLFNGKVVADVGCGVGYGSHVLAASGCQVMALDRSEAALAYGEQHYAHAKVTRHKVDLTQPFDLVAECAVAFEIMEHVPDPVDVLRSLAGCRQLLVSVPNELVFQWSAGLAYHVRHYTPEQLEGLLNHCGWEVAEWWGQAGPQSECVPDTQGRTAVALCRRAEPGATPTPETWRRLPAMERQGLGRVAIVAMGASNQTWMHDVNLRGPDLWDETWAINSMGGVLRHDALFHMDDLRLQAQRAQRRPWGPIAAMMRWLKEHPGPVYTPTHFPEFPGSVAYPLGDVVDDLGAMYFNNTVAYAMALAIHKKASRIGLFGCDFTYPNAHKAEQGRACLEFWIAYATFHRDIDVSLPVDTTLLDACVPEHERPYGYCDRYQVGMRNEGGRSVVELKPRETLPTVDELEQRYNHLPRFAG